MGSAPRLLFILAAAASDSAVEYFGFWGPDAPAAMSNFTNLAFANDAGEASDNSARGIASLMKVQSVFVNSTVQWAFALRDDYLDRWHAQVPLYEALLANGTLLGFFLGDELPWNGLPFEHVQTIARTVRASFQAGSAIVYTNAAWPTQFPAMPGRPQSPGAIAGVPDANLWTSVPAELDWFSADVGATLDRRVFSTDFATSRSLRVSPRRETWLECNL